MSQYGEHEAILRHFEGRDSAALRFLDVGAFDGVVNSNTRMLSDAGWGGVCVEPSPPAFCQLMRNYFGNGRVLLVNAALLGDGAGLRPFDCNSADGVTGDQVSTLSPEHRDKWHGYPFRRIWIPVVTWKDLSGLAPSNVLGWR
jgi:hypothetical protein